MKSWFHPDPLPSFSEAAPKIPALFSNSHRAETLRQLQTDGYPVADEKLPRIQEQSLGFSLEEEELEGSMPWVAERGMAVHRAYGAFLQTADRNMLADVSLNTVVDYARRLGHPVVGTPVDGSKRPDGVAVNLPATRPTPLSNLVELKPKGTALTGEGPAQVAAYKASLEGCGLATALMPVESPLANTVLTVPGYGEVQFTGMQDGLVGYNQIRRQPAPEMAPQEAPAEEKMPSLWEQIRVFAESIRVSAEVAVGVLLLLVAIVLLGLLLHLPPPVPA